MPKTLMALLLVECWLGATALSVLAACALTQGCGVSDLAGIVLLIVSGLAGLGVTRLFRRALRSWNEFGHATLVGLLALFLGLPLAFLVMASLLAQKIRSC